MSVTTFAELITKSNTRKVFLVEVDPSELLEDWTLYTGSIYYQSIGNRHVLSVYENGTAMTEAASAAAVGSGEWYYDHNTGRLYAAASTGTIYSRTIVANHRLYFCSNLATAGAGVIFNNRFYEPVVKSTPRVQQAKQDLFWGVSVVSSGEIALHNNDGYFDTIYESYAWANKAIKILLGGESLPYSEYATMFDGIVSDAEYETDAVVLQFVDKKAELKDSLPARSFSVSDWPDMQSEISGRAVPYAFGTVYRIPAICVDGDKAAPSVYTFKYADTSLGSCGAIGQVYVDGIAVTEASSNVSRALFTLSINDYSLGSVVTLDCQGYLSGTTLVENPIDILKKLLGEMGIEYDDDNYDTATMSTARTEADVFPIGLSVSERTPLITLGGEIMKSCLGVLYVNNAGQYAVKIWDTDLPSDPVELNELDIKRGSFTVRQQQDPIRKVVRVGWRKRWDTEEHTFSQDTSDVTEKLYDISRSRTVYTLLSSEAGVAIYLGRMLIMLERATTEMRFTEKMRLAEHNIGDRFEISFKRRQADTELPWLIGRTVEIQKIEKKFADNEIEVTVDDLRGIGGNVGHWTEDNPTFPATLGGGSAETWDPTWSEAQKLYARERWGFWADDDGFADPTDASTRNKSRWW